MDAESGQMKYSTDDIKRTTVKHIQETLRDREPKERHEEIVAHRKVVIDEASKVRGEKRVKFSKEEMEAVVRAMAGKNKDCHRPITKSSKEFRTAVLNILNKYAEKEKVPKSFTKTSLTQLKKPKGAYHELGAYRFIHTKTWPFYEEKSL